MGGIAIGIGLIAGRKSTSKIGVKSTESTENSKRYTNIKLQVRNNNDNMSILFDNADINIPLVLSVMGSKVGYTITQNVYEQLKKSDIYLGGTFYADMELDIDSQIVNKVANIHDIHNDIEYETYTVKFIPFGKEKIKLSDMYTEYVEDALETIDDSSRDKSIKYVVTERFENGLWKRASKN